MNTSIIRYFEDVVENYKDKVAVKSGNDALTYEELNIKANKIALEILKFKTMEAQTVNLLFEHGIDMIAGMLGILKAGKIYVPLDPTYPEERLKYIINDSESKILITNNQNIALAERLFKDSIKIINIDYLIQEENQCNPSIKMNAEQPAYILYTSGSTGKPKGAIQNHKNILRHIGSFIEKMKLDAKSKMALFSSYGHTIAVIDIFGILLSGGTIFPYDLKTNGNMIAIRHWLIDEEINIIHIVPGLFRALTRVTEEENPFSLIRQVILSGEAVTKKDFEIYKKYFTNDCLFINLLGATELIVATINILNKESELTRENVPIGEAVQGVELKLMDEQNLPQKILEVGEIFYHSDYITPGYWKLPQKTNETFGLDAISGKRIYKSGDMGRLLPDGGIEYIGRKDFQVKIRGYRVELAEIEMLLMENEEIKDVVVAAKEDKDRNNLLCAYIVTQGGTDIAKYRKQLKKKLPSYMVPTYIMELKELPRTLTGKLDRNALPEPDRSAAMDVIYEAPTNEIEEKLIELWKSVLEVEEIGINHNFFDLGGHSLKAMYLISEVHKVFHVELKVTNIFEYPTIKELSRIVGEAEESAYTTIQRVEEKEYYELSPAQKRMYILNQFNSNTSYNTPVVLKIEGKLDENKLRNVLGRIIKRHEVFRTSFELLNKETVQRIHSEVNFEVEWLEAQEDQIPSLIENFIREFDLSKAPILRACLMKLSLDKHILIIDTHHIIFDGASVVTLLREINELYDDIELPELNVQYKDFAAWQNKYLESEALKKQEDYWLEVFKGEIPVLNMPTDFKRPQVQSFEGSSIDFEIESKIADKLNRISSEYGSTLYMTILAAYNVLLHKYTGQEDIVIGSPIAGRNHSDLKPLIGMFVNTLAMRNHLTGTMSFKDFLSTLRENALKAYENQDYQFESLVEKLNIVRDTSRNPLLDVMFAYESIDNDKEHQNLKFEIHPYEGKTAKFDITLKAIEIDGEIKFSLEYCTKLYREETIAKLIESFKNILHQVAKDPEIKIADIEIMSSDEKNRILYEFNDTYAEYPREKTIHQLFEEQVEKTPDDMAVVYEDKKLTYRELNEKSNRLARTLREKGVKPDTIVGIMVDRSLEMIIGIMGILKAGGAYLPIDPEYPIDRIKYMLGDSRSKLLLTQGHLVDRAKFDVEVIDIGNESMYSGNSYNLEKINTSKDLAYVIYTSGSTGKPKGVMIEHKSIGSLIKGLYEEIYSKYDKKLNVALIAPYVFDASVQQIFITLLLGNSLYIAPEEARLSARDLINFYEKNLIDISDGTPMHLQILVNGDVKSISKMNVKTFIIGGDSLPYELVNNFYNKFTDKRATINNVYGPTECCVDATLYNICSKNVKIINKILIGKPLANTQIYIINKNNKLQPVGIVGELCISGAGLARGYLNNTELTEEKFVNNPFVPGERMYKTGDLARWLPDGNIEYLGRMDHQVKIRGFRIELGEIESQLLNHDSIKETIVIDREDSSGVKYLCAYIVANSELNIGELRKYLSKSLPEYMIPSYFVKLEDIPLTLNGKVDRRALPNPDGSIALGTEYEAPRNEIEEKLTEMWRNLLGIDKVGIGDNFFEVGGHSLKAMFLMSEVHKAFNVELKLTDIFQYPRIKELSGIIGEAKESIYTSIQRVEKREYYELSPAQSRMYILNQLNSDTTYNIPLVLRVEGNLDKNKLENVFRKIIKRHEVFRTSFEMVNKEVVQRIHSEVKFEIECFEAQENQIPNLVNSFVREFDLAKAPLLRVGLVKLSLDKHILIIDTHHIIFDGASVATLFREINELYGDLELSELNMQYKDFAAWQNKYLKSDALKKQEEYWLDVFKGEIPVLNMPTDFKRPQVQSFEGSCIDFEIESKITERLKRVSSENGSTLYMTILAAYNVLLHKYTGQEDIVIGSPIAGRNHRDLEPLIGIFVNTLAMRNHLTGKLSFKDFLSTLKENALKAYENQDYQFESLIEKLSITRDISRNPLLDVMFAYESIDNDKEYQNLKFEIYPYDRMTAQLDMSLRATEMNGDIKFSLEYCTKLYKKETIAKLIESFKNILHQVAKDPEIKIADIEIMSLEEKNRILYDFNNTRAYYPENKTIHEIFEEQAVKTPDNIAAVFGGHRLTYRELNERANQVARHLRIEGIKADSIVGIMTERSMEMLIGIMGILKAGGAYLPIDPKYPMDRIEYMLKDSKTSILLIQKQFNSKVNFEGQIIEIDNENIYVGDNTNLDSINGTNDLAYIIYTSGSTGRPKGVMIEHHSVINRLNWMQKSYTLGEEDTILQKTPFTFDVSVWELFWWALSGSKVCMLTPEGEKDPEEIIKVIEAQNITTIHFVPAMLNTFLGHVETNGCLGRVSSLKHVFVSGEALNLKQVKKFNELLNRSHGTKLHNLYGPTEATVDVTYYECSEGVDLDIIPIGKPIDNTKLYILDKDNKLQPIGVAGELCIAGEGLARGYLNKSELTNEKFMQASFDGKYERVYKTGDLARWMSDGEIEYLGRIDNQVKIRGYRIELGEIESRLLSHKDIKEVVVNADVDKDNDKYLCAYFVAAKEFSVVELREYLGKDLPEYMIPSVFMQLEKIPLTANGKVDMKALPKSSGNVSSGVAYEAPRNETEEKLAEIWRKVLGIDKVGIGDNFFELGGQSLKAITVMAEIRNTLNTELKLMDIFKSPTIKELSKIMGDTGIGKQIQISPVEKGDYYPLSPAQLRMYLLRQRDDIGTSYNMPLVMEVEGNLDRKRLELVFKELIGRHEALRTSFESRQGNVVQRIHEKVEFEVQDLEVKDDISQIIQGFVSKFDLEKAPLFRVGLIKLNAERHILVVDIDHIIFDGISLGVLLKEFTALYEGTELTELKLQYRDFAVWQNGYLESEALREQEKYWLDTFKSEIPILNLPTDYPRPSVISYEGDEYNFELSRELTESLVKLSKETGSTMFMTLFAGYNVLLSKISEQEDVIVGVPSAGRRQAGLSDIIGMFVNTLAMRSKPAKDKYFTEFLEEVKVNALKAIENQDYQFEMLLEKINILREAGRSPLFDTIFNYQNTYEEDTMSEFTTGNLKLKLNWLDRKTTTFDITLFIVERKDKISFKATYRKDLFEGQTIEYLMNEYLRMLEQIADNPNKKLEEYQILAPKRLNQGVKARNLRDAIKKSKYVSLL